MSSREAVQNLRLEEKPAGYPERMPDGKPLKDILRVLLDRRATQHFSPEPVSKEYLDAILSFAAQSPSGYNFQPWRFIVVQEAENKARLRKVAYNQAKISEAAAVVIAVGMKQEWKSTVGEVLEESVARGFGKKETLESYKESALGFLSRLPMDVWVTRHTMIAFTTLMLVAEAFGFDTAPMEGFDPEGVKREFGIPQEGEVVALLAIGRASGAEKPYTGRFGLERIVHAERFGKPWARGAAVRAAKIGP